jgi:hypothetical protein
VDLRVGVHSPLAGAGGKSCVADGAVREVVQGQAMASARARLQRGRGTRSART